MAGGSCCSSGKCHDSGNQNNSPQTAHQSQDFTTLLLSSDSSFISPGGTTSDATEISTESLEESNIAGDERSDTIVPTLSAGPMATSQIERIVLTIEGLKCGCCESGISRALGQIPGVQNHYVNVVLARAEFNLDVRTTSINKVKKKLTAATGCTFEQYFQPTEQVLEVRVTDPQKEIYKADNPPGVYYIEPVTNSTWVPRIFSGRNSAVPPASSTSTQHHKGVISNAVEVFSEDDKRNLARMQHTVRIHYDAKNIGARQIILYYEKLWKRELQLIPLPPHPSLAAGDRQAKHAGWLFLLAAAFTIPVIFLAWGPVDHANPNYAHISLAFATVIQLIVIKEFFPGALRTIIYSHMFDMDALIALSTTVAYAFSVTSYALWYHGKPLDTEFFFETSCLLVTLILMGRTISEIARFRAAQSVSFRSLQAATVNLVLGDPSIDPPAYAKVDCRLLQYGDYFKVEPHEKIVTDGIVVHGGSDVDESMLTGEAVPVAKGIDSEVYGGTNNGNSSLVVRLTKLPHENSVARIATMVEHAQLTKPKVQAIADRIAAWFVPVIVGIALSVFTIWITVDKFYFRYTTSKAAIEAFTYSIATFIVSCPCAIGLAVPMVILIASGISARAGIIFRDPQKLETARNVTDVIFDKTGTLTDGVLTVVHAKFKDGSEECVVSMLLQLLSGIKHPVSVAVHDWVLKQKYQGYSPPPAEMIDIQSLPGEGVQGVTKLGNHLVRAGSPSWLGTWDDIDMPPLEGGIVGQGYTYLCVTIDGISKASFFLQSSLRQTAKSTIEQLQARKIRVHMLTGDEKAAACAVAQALGIPNNLVRSRCRPDEKKSYVDGLQANGNTVMFIGDGTNDAIALKQAAIGVHLSRGSDVAKSAADIVLLNPHLLDVITLLDISHAAYRRIILNFVWSGVYNVLAVLAASGALRVWRIKPEFAGLGELVSVLPIVGIAFSMKWRGYGTANRRQEKRAEAELADKRKAEAEAAQMRAEADTAGKKKEAESSKKKETEVKVAVAEFQSAVAEFVEQQKRASSLSQLRLGE